MHTPPEFITHGRVELRRAQPGDHQALFVFATDPEVMRFMDWPIPTSPGETRAYLEGSYAEWNAGSQFQWVILERGTRTIAGTISCRPRGHAADFGYFLGRSFWGRGLAFDAASAVVTWLLQQPQILRVWATADAGNSRSRRLLERLGLQLEGVMRMATIRPNIGGPPGDTALYARTRTGN